MKKTLVPLTNSLKIFYKAFNDNSFKKNFTHKRNRKEKINSCKYSPVVSSFINTINIFFERQEFKQKQKLIANQKKPLSINEYFTSFFWFLLEESNLVTGIDFNSRLKIECLRKTENMNAWCKYNGLPPINPSSPDFIEALNATLLKNPKFINEILDEKQFITLEQHKKYELTFKYKISGKEKEAVGDLEEITQRFNINFQNSRGSTQNGIIHCNEVTFDGKFLYFHLTHYGKWKDPNNILALELEIVAPLKSSSTNGIPILHDYERNKIISVTLEDTPHFLICGETGSGKTFFSTFLVASVCNQTQNTHLFIFDFKGDEAFHRFKKHERYYHYKECQEGLEKLYDLFSKRLDGSNKERHLIIVLFDELASYINSFQKRAEKEIQQKMISEILMMGRSKKIHLFTSTQRPDAELFKLGSRINYSFKYLMGNSCINSDSQKMMFDTKNIDFKSCKQGCGYVSINGGTPTLASVPTIDNLQTVYNVLDRALLNGITINS